MIAWGKTDRGLVRTENQDDFHIHESHDTGYALCVVCDGMGGAKAGGVASTLASEMFAEDVLKNLKNHMSEDYIVKITCEAVNRTNSHLYAKSLSDDAYSGMGTTLVAVVTDGDDSVFVNVGDSRAYLINEDGILRITRDHSVVEDMLMMGDLTREEARTHPGKNLITRALGTEEAIECDHYIRKLNKGDNILLCSDGLTNMVEDQEILYEVLHGGAKELACDRLTDIANSRGGRDNITVVLLVI